MYGLYLPTWLGKFWQMLVNIPYMEHMGKAWISVDICRPSKPRSQDTSMANWGESLHPPQWLRTWEHLILYHPRPLPRPSVCTCFKNIQKWCFQIFPRSLSTSPICWWYLEALGAAKENKHQRPQQADRSKFPAGLPHSVQGDGCQHTGHERKAFSTWIYHGMTSKFLRHPGTHRMDQDGSLLGRKLVVFFPRSTFWLNHTHYQMFFFETIKLQGSTVFDPDIQPGLRTLENNSKPSLNHKQVVFLLVYTITN